MNAGDTFIDGLYNHLWIVLSDPATDRDNIVVVNVTSYHAEVHQEHAQCVLVQADHSFIKHKSVVRFEDCLVVAEADYEVLVRGNQMTPHRACSAALLKKVRKEAGNLRKRIPGKARRILEDQDLI